MSYYKSIPTTIILSMLVIFNQTSAEIINIPDDFETIQRGIDNAEEGDTVLVAPGTYREHIVVQNRQIVLASWLLTTGEREYIDSTVIDGSGRGRVVYVLEDIDENTLIRGFTLQNADYRYGAGIHCYLSSPRLMDLTVKNCNGSGMGLEGGAAVVENCLLELNDADDGGGINCFGNAQPHLINLLVRSNTADTGGGILINGASPLIENCIIENNNASRMGGGIYFDNIGESVVLNSIIRNNEGGSNGGGVRIDEASVLFENCIIEENQSYVGSAAANGGNPEVVYRNCIFRDNEVIGIGGGPPASTIWLYETASVTFDHVQIVDNYGTSIFLQRNNDCEIINSTISRNRAHEHAVGGIHFQYDSGVTIVNSILYNNEGGAFKLIDPDAEQTLVISYSCIEGGEEGVDEGVENLEWGEGNIDTDPLFVDPDSADYHLTGDSPCIDAGDPELPEDPDGTRADIGALHLHQRDIEVEPDSLLFVDVQTDSVDSLAVTVLNVGLTTLNLMSVGINSFSAPLDVDDLEEDVSLEPDSVYTIWVRYTPYEQGECFGTLVIESDDPDEEFVEVFIIANALSVDDNTVVLPTEFALYSVYPNPFNSFTTITYGLPVATQISIQLCDLSGREVRTLFEGNEQAGVHRTMLNAGDLPSGLYVVRLQASGKHLNQKVMLVK